MSQKINAAIAVIGIDIGKNSLHIVGHDHRGAIVLRQKWSRGQVETRLANLPPCLIGMEACTHHLSRKLQMLGQDARLMNMSRDPEQEYFADGMVEDIIRVCRVHPLTIDDLQRDALSGMW